MASQGALAMCLGFHRGKGRKAGCGPRHGASGSGSPPPPSLGWGGSLSPGRPFSHQRMHRVIKHLRSRDERRQGIEWIFPEHEGRGAGNLGGGPGERTVSGVSWVGSWDGKQEGDDERGVGGGTRGGVGGRAGGGPRHGHSRRPHSERGWAHFTGEGACQGDHGNRRLAVESREVGQRGGGEAPPGPASPSPAHSSRPDVPPHTPPRTPSDPLPFLPGSTEALLLLLLV